MIHPGPNFSVADVHHGWMEALRGMGEQVSEYCLDRRLQFYCAVMMETGNHDAEGHPEFKRALTREEAVDLAAAGLLAACYQFLPDVILLTSGFFTPPWVMKIITQRRHKVVCLFTETPYQTEMQLQMASYADVILLNDPTGAATYEQFGVPVAYTPHAYRPSLHKPGPAHPEMKCDLTFVGTGYPSRIKFFEAMDLDGLDVFLAGNWLAARLDSPIRTRWLAHDSEECLDNEQTVEAYRSAKAGINLYRREAEDEHLGEGWAMGPREVEMAATGLFYLRDHRPEGDALLPMLPVFDGPGDASEKLRWWLARDAERDQAARLARAAVADRTFENNARELLRLLDRQPIRI